MYTFPKIHIKPNKYKQDANDQLLYFVSESVTPLVLETQKQFSFTHILAPATAFGKVRLFYVLTENILSQEDKCHKA